ncbi:MAG: hypothetical protein AMJ78_04105 [Omnitrophica WOR_2 bacterium SM23_29]|nr:MAG: hypothetical protein AMJ78_04105 [Omnitrophica WOR_2 bacterium SM23_29]
MSFESIIKALKVNAAKDKRKVYLVGGFIRDLLIKGRSEALEMDFAVDDLTLEFAGNVAAQLNGTFIPLDEERGIARVMLKGEFQLDFNRFKGRTIESDLKARDFTINAIACDIANIKMLEDIKNFLLDPCHGRSDIQNRLIRATNPNSFADDPLRILRAFTFAAAFGFEIEPKTFNLIKTTIPQLKAMAGERVRDELSKILEVGNSIKYIRMLDELKIFDEIVPEVELMRGVRQGPYHHLDIWDHSIDSLAQLEELLNEFSRDMDLNTYLSRPITDSRKAIWIVKLGALLHDIGKPRAREITETGKIRFHGHEAAGVELIQPIAKSLRLSAKERTLLEDIILFHLRAAQLANAKDVTKRAVLRLLRDMKDSTPAVCLVTIADKRATRGELMKISKRDSIEELSLRLIKEYFAAKKVKIKPKRLLTGDDIIELLKIPSGHIIGTILKEIEESQAEGTIKNRDEALRLAKKIYEELK